MKMQVDLQKSFLIYHVSQMLGGPSLRLGIPTEADEHSSRNWMRWEGHWSTGNVGISTAN